MKESPGEKNYDRHFNERDLIVTVTIVHIDKIQKS